MATSTIPMLTQAIGLTGSEQLEAVQAGSSVRITAQQIANLVTLSAANIATGSFVAILTGVAVTVEGTIYYSIVANTCTLTSVTSLQGTSNTTTLSLAGIPTLVQPKTASPTVPCIITSGNTNLLGAANIPAGGNAVNFYLQQTQTGTNPVGIVLSATSFANPGTNGLPGGWTITYPLN